MRSDLKKLDSFTLETSKNHLIRNFLRNGCVRVNKIIIIDREKDPLKKRGDLRGCLSKVTLTLNIVTRGSRVSRAPPHHTLPAFLNLHGSIKFFIDTNDFQLIRVESEFSSQTEFEALTQPG